MWLNLKLWFHPILNYQLGKWKYNLRFSHLYDFRSKSHIECLITTYKHFHTCPQIWWQSLSSFDTKFRTKNLSFRMMTSGDIWPFLTHFLLRNYSIEQIGLQNTTPARKSPISFVYIFLRARFFNLFSLMGEKNFVNLKFVYPIKRFVFWKLQVYITSRKYIPRLAWPHFLCTKLHSLPNGDFWKIVIS